MYEISFSGLGGWTYAAPSSVLEARPDLGPVQKQHWARLESVVRQSLPDVRTDVAYGKAVMDLPSVSIRIEMTPITLTLALDPMPIGDESAEMVATAHKIAKVIEKITGFDAVDREFSKPFARVAPTDTQRVLSIMHADRQLPADSPPLPGGGRRWQTESARRRRDERRKTNKARRKQARKARRKR